MPSAGMSIAAGLLLASTVFASPKEATFVGDANADKPDAAAAKSAADYRRWGGGSNDNDRAPSVFLKEAAAGKLQIRHADPVADRALFQAYLTKLAAAPAGSSDAKEYARIMARLALIPVAQRNFKGDMHPIEYLEFMKSLPDNTSGLVLPPQNHIKIVDQDAIQALKDAGKPMPAPQYRTTTTTIITHHLVPTFKDVYTEYPV